MKSRTWKTWLCFACLLLLAAGPEADQPTDLFISEYIEGSSNNKAIEIYNGTGAAVDLAAAGYNLQVFFNGATSAGLTISLAGTVAAGDVFVVAQASANAAILAQAGFCYLGTGRTRRKGKIALKPSSRTPLPNSCRARICPSQGQFH